MDFYNLPRGVPGTEAAVGKAPRALWLHPSELENPFWTFEPGKIFLGASQSGAPVGVDDNRHLLTVAGSRAGKGVSAIIPNLFLYPGSVMVLDPKGENARITAQFRADGGHSVHVLDPFGISGVDPALLANWNPMAALDPDDPAFVDDCDSIADALVIDAGSRESSHWDDMARLVLRGFIAWVAASPIHEGERNLITVRELLNRPSVVSEDDDSGFESLLATMIQENDVAHGVSSETAGALLGTDDRERGSIMSTVRKNIGFLSSPPMAELLAGGSREPDVKEWRFGRQAVYLCLPATRLHRHSRFYRLFVNALLSALEDGRDPPEQPGLMILDEIATLGRMAQLETAIGLVAGFGVRIWSFWQDFAQAKQLYKDRWESFVGNAGIMQFFGLSDNTTLEYVSKRLGQSSVASISQGEISRNQAASGFSGQSRSIQYTPLLAPHEVAYWVSRQSRNQIILCPGNDPLLIKRMRYFTKAFQALI